MLLKGLEQFARLVRGDLGAVPGRRVEGLLGEEQAHEAGVSRATAAYSWLMAHPSGAIPIVGTQQPARIAEAAGAATVRWTRAEWYAVLAESRGAPLP